MKKLLKLIFAIAIFTLGANQIFAQEEIYLRTLNGVELTKEQYNNLIKSFDHNTIITMNAEMLEEIKNEIDFKSVSKEKYIKSTIVYDQGQVVSSNEEEVSLNEFTNSDVTEPIYVPIQVATTETTYRRLKMTIVVWGSGSNNMAITLTNTWKQLPSMKTYDVLAIAPGLSVSLKASGYKSAYQEYDGNIINYSVTGDKWNEVKGNVIFGKGIGISQNLVDAATSSIENSMTYRVTALAPNQYPYKVRGAYAHAIVDTPLAQSKKYTLGSGGIGNLIIFNSSVASHYESSSADGIQMAYNGDQTI